MWKIEIQKNKNVYLTISLFSVLFFLTIFPLLKFKYPILIDYPNHLASYFIQANIDNNIWLKENYKVEWHIKPYLIIEGLGGLLAKYMDVYMAGRLLIILGMAFICAGALLLRKAVNGRIDLWMATLFVFIYNLILLWGFINFYVGAGLSLIFMGVWIKRRKAQIFVNFILFSILSSILFFCHFFDLFIYFVFVISYELGIYKYSRGMYSIYNLTKAIAQFILPLGLFFVYYHNNLQDNYVGDYYRYGDFKHKIITFLSPIMFDNNIYSEFAVIVVIVSTITFGLFFRRGKIYDEMKLPLLSFVIMSVIMPVEVAGGWGIDLRCPFFLMILLLASVKFDENEKSSTSFIRSALFVSIIMTCLKIYFINDKWERLGLQYREFENSLQNISLGSKILTIKSDSKILPGLEGHYFDNISALAVIERSCFWTGVWTAALTPIYPTEKNKLIDPAAKGQLKLEFLLDKNAKNGVYYKPAYTVVYWENWTHNFDYLISIRFEDLSIIDIKNLKLKFRGSFFDIYQIVH